MIILKKKENSMTSFRTHDPLLREKRVGFAGKYIKIITFFQILYNYIVRRLFASDCSQIQEF
jgi:hypothetical protein